MNLSGIKMRVKFVKKIPVGENPYFDVDLKEVNSKSQNNIPYSSYFHGQEPIMTDSFYHYIFGMETLRTLSMPVQNYIYYYM